MKPKNLDARIEEAITDLINTARDTAEDNYKGPEFLYQKREYLENLIEELYQSA